MSETAAIAEAENEDRLVVPEHWRTLMHPRRGEADPNVPVPAHTGSTAALQELYGPEVEAEVRSCLSNPRTLPSVVEPLRQQLDGHPSPLGAAALAVLAVDGRGGDMSACLDAWITAYGLPFAAAATVEASRLLASTTHRGYQAQIVETNDSALRGWQISVARTLRTYLAAASGDVYAAAVREVADYRGKKLRQRVVVSYLFPDESAWLAEVCSEVGKWKLYTSEWRPLVALLHYSISRPEELAALRKRKPFHPDFIDPAALVTATVALGGEVVGLFPPALDGQAATADIRRTALDVIVYIPCDEAFELLTARLTTKHVRAAVIDASRRFPRRAIRLLARAACAADANAEAARILLAGRLARHGELVAEVLPSLSEDERALIEQLNLEAAVLPEASADALPSVLVSPPWARKRPRKTADASAAANAVDFSGLEAPADSRVVWTPGERQDFERRRVHHKQATEWQRTLERIEQQGTSGSAHQDRAALLGAPEGRARQALPHLRSTFDGWDQVDALGGILARFGADAFGPILHRADGADLTQRAVLLQPMVDLRVARLMADWLLRLKSVRPQARLWLERHRETAAILLLPDALGSDRGLRKAAEEALRYLAGLAFDVAAVAERAYGADAAIAVKTIVDVDPLDLVPARPPKLADWLRDAQLPQILLHDRRTALPAESVRHVLTMLAISRPGEPYAGLEIVRQYTDPISLAAFGRALLEAWRTVDYPAKESWIVPAQSVLGDDETVRRLVPLIRSWPRESAHQRATAGLDVLAELDTEYALVHLHLIGKSSPRRTINNRAQDKLASVAAKRGMTADQLIDRLTPGFGLDGSAALWLDYGGRRFQVRYDEHLRATLVDESGAHCPGGVLPETMAADDAGLAEAARAQLSALNEDVHTLTAHVIQRMDVSMAMRRSWTAAEFRSLLLGHPLLWQVVSRVVWLCEADGTATAFRVDEDRGFADVKDHVFELPEHALVSVAHPLRLGADLGAWAELFADYEILQPFVQLGRPVYTLTDAELAAAPFNRFEGITVPSAEVHELLERGWEGALRGYGFERRLVRPTLDGRWLILNLDPGIAMSADQGGEAPDQLVESIVLGDARDAGEPDQDGQAAGLRALDAVTLSEVLGDFHRLSER